MIRECLIQKNDKGHLRPLGSHPIILPLHIWVRNAVVQQTLNVSKKKKCFFSSLPNARVQHLHPLETSVWKQLPSVFSFAKIPL